MPTSITQHHGIDEENRGVMPHAMTSIPRRLAGPQRLSLLTLSPLLILWLLVFSATASATSQEDERLRITCQSYFLDRMRNDAGIPEALVFQIPFPGFDSRNATGLPDTPSFELAELLERQQDGQRAVVGWSQSRTSNTMVVYLSPEGNQSLERRIEKLPPILARGVHVNLILQRTFGQNPALLPPLRERLSGAGLLLTGEHLSFSQIEEEIRKLEAAQGIRILGWEYLQGPERRRMETLHFQKERIEGVIARDSLENLFEVPGLSRIENIRVSKRGPSPTVGLPQSNIQINPEGLYLMETYPQFKNFFCRLYTEGDQELVANPRSRDDFNRNQVIVERQVNLLTPKAAALGLSVRTYPVSPPEVHISGGTLGQLHQLLLTTPEIREATVTWDPRNANLLSLDLAEE